MNENKNNIRAFIANEYIDYIRLSISIIMHYSYDLFVLHDNYDSLLIPFIRLLHKNKPIVYDSSEFYPLYELRNKNLSFIIKMKSFILAICEKCFIRKADLIIAANAERASIMKKYYKIKKDITIYDNMHYIADEYNSIICEEKYSQLFNHGRFVILNAGGIANDRYIYEIADAVANLGDDYVLLIAGGGTDKEISQFEKKYMNIQNIKYLGFVPRSELKFLIQKVDICFTGFKPVSINNIYCASGKTYESLMEGTPILCSENPPLKRLCKDFDVGICCNNFASAIKQMRSNYEFYKKNALAFRYKINYSERRNRFINKLKVDLNI